MKKNIIRRQLSETMASGLLGLHPVLQRIFAARNIRSLEEIETNLDKLLPYHALLGLEAALPILLQALTNNQHIMIVGDFDADGATSTAVAIRALKSFGATNISYLVPNRFAYGYGLSPELVVTAKERSPDVIITVDNGIANHAGVDKAKAFGMKVIITDHHLAAATLPAADAIINPNQPHDLFPSKNLAGVGVIFYVMLALRRYLSEYAWFETKKIKEPNMSQLLDLVALGTVADLVPLDQNNRILVHQGLRRMRSGQCAPGIIALLEVAGRDFRSVTSADLGFAVGARLNAAGRLDDMSLGIECLLCDDSIKARQMATVLDQLNQERRSIEKDMQTQALEALDKINVELNNSLPRGICLFDETWHQGVIGILASRIKDKFHRPVIIFAPGLGDEIKGSARSIPGLHIRDVLALIDANHPGLLLKFGGHAMAAGMTIEKNNFSNFSKIFNDTVSQIISEEALKHFYQTDGELGDHEISLEVASLLRDAGPWGQAFPEPVFDNVFHVLDQRIVGDKHLKLKLGNKDKIIDAIVFFADTNTWPNHRCQQVHAVYRLDINEYKAKCNVQLIIDYLEPVNILNS